MVKMLKRALGREVSDNRPGTDVIGRVDKSLAGNSILEVGVLNPDKSWTKVQDGGHIALKPDEREELIAVLKSHRDVPRIELGDVVGGPLAATVLAVEYHFGGDPERTNGTVLAYSDHKREYWVWSITSDGTLENGVWKRGMQDALNVYQTRTTDRLYSFFNSRPPALTFGHVAERDKLKEDA